MGSLLGLLLLVVGVARLSAFRVNHDALMCDLMQKNGCTGDINEVCGSDQQTYASTCHLELANCLSENIVKVSQGACGVIPDAPQALPLTSNNDNCMRTCPRNISPVCASNGNTYSNMCKFLEAQCRQPGLILAGECISRRRRRGII